MNSVAEYYKNFMQDLIARSGANSNYLESVFTEGMCDFLVDQAIVQNYTIAEYKKSARGKPSVRLDAFDYNDETEVLSLFIVDFRAEKEVGSLTKTEIEKSFKLAERFLDKCQSQDFYSSLEESTPGYAAAREIHNSRSKISRVQFFLLSNRELSSRVKSLPSQAENWSYHIWDIGRMSRIESSGKTREDMVVKFENGIPCLPAFTGSEKCKSFLLALPGQLVASLYEAYGERLLEQNVRTFLQFRGKVNKGMRNTIQNDPDMFFAYNNGLTTTAENVEFDEGTSSIRSVTNLQIVNGGQTTASLFTAKRKNSLDLSKVYVQVKLSVIPPTDVERVVPRISEYANTQNKVNAADFFSNHPFHLRIEEFSRRLWAPSGGTQDTHWFYERSRGQFANAYANMTLAKQKEFLLMNPKNQMFTKTDLAKYQYSFGQTPHIVSKGAQTCFALFANNIGKQWDKDEKQFNELYFKQAIAKAVVFRSLDKQIMDQPWYGGYKANIVTYSLAKLMNMIEIIGYNLDLMSIWKNQKISEALNSQLLIIAESVNYTIQDTEANVTQYCKQELCWQKVQRVNLDINERLLNELITKDEVKQRKKDAGKKQIMLNGIEAQTYVFEKGADYWISIKSWNEDLQVLSPKELGVLDVAVKIPQRIPTEAQCKIILEAEKKAASEGFPV